MTSNPSQALYFENVPVPFTHPVSYGGLPDDAVIELDGRLEAGSESFELNLVDEGRNNILLHVRLRDADPQHKRLVVNSFHNGSWQNEKSQQVVIEDPRVRLIVKADRNQYKINLVGVHETHMPYRQPRANITALRIGGGIIIHSLYLHKFLPSVYPGLPQQPHYLPQPAPFPGVSPQQHAPTGQPAPLPYTTSSQPFIPIGPYSPFNQVQNGLPGQALPSPFGPNPSQGPPLEPQHPYQTGRPGSDPIPTPSAPPMPSAPDFTPPVIPGIASVPLLPTAVPMAPLPVGFLPEFGGLGPRGCQDRCDGRRGGFRNC